jgi:hypothetical protein
MWSKRSEFLRNLYLLGIGNIESPSKFPSGSILSHKSHRHNAVLRSIKSFSFDYKTYCNHLSPFSKWLLWYMSQVFLCTSDLYYNRFLLKRSKLVQQIWSHWMRKQYLQTNPHELWHPKLSLKSIIEYRIFIRATIQNADKKVRDSEKKWFCFEFISIYFFNEHKINSLLSFLY